MPTEGDRYSHFRSLTPRWIASLDEVIRSAEPELAKVWASPFELARAHRFRHSDGREGHACKLCGAAEALIFLQDVTVRHFDDLRQASKLTARLHDHSMRAFVRYETQLQSLTFEPTEAERLQLLLARAGLFLIQARATVSEFAKILGDEAAYSGRFSKKDPYALLDTVTRRLLTTFTDAEIAERIPDGGPAEGAVARVSNRRLKWTRSRVAGTKRRASKSTP